MAEKVLCCYCRNSGCHRAETPTGSMCTQLSSCFSRFPALLKQSDVKEGWFCSCFSFGFYKILTVGQEWSMFWSSWSETSLFVHSSGITLCTKRLFLKARYKITLGYCVCPEGHQACGLLVSKQSQHLFLFLSSKERYHGASVLPNA